MGTDEQANVHLVAKCQRDLFTGKRITETGHGHDEGVAFSLDLNDVRCFD